MALCVLCLLCAPAAGSADGVVVLTRDDIIPYAVFLNAFVESAEKDTLRSAALRTFSVHGLSDDEQRRIAEQISACEPSLLVCVGSGALGFARTHFTTVPALCAMVVNPAMLREAAGHVSCLRMEVSPREKLSVLKKILPGVRRIGAVYDPSQCADQVRLLRDAASGMGIELDARAVSSAKEAIGALEDVMRNIDALVMFYDKTVLAPQPLNFLYKLSFRHSVPVLGLSEKYVRLGALFSLDADAADLGRAAWQQARTCLSGSAACAGVRYPDVPGRLYVNATIAPKMNITVAESLLRQAVLVE